MALETINGLLADAYGSPVSESEDSGSQTAPGEIIGWPMLKLNYLTDKDRIAALLPPGLEPGEDPLVNITIYNYPVQNEPEYGVVVNVSANYQGTEGDYSLAVGIDQEAAVFISQERWGQPKFLADIHYYRMLDGVDAKVIHQGHTFVEFHGKVVGAQKNLPDVDQNEWWIKCVRDGDLTPGKYDFPPHVVHVYSRYGTAQLLKLDGEIVLRESPWDPMAKLLPMREQVSAHLWSPTFLDRRITLAGALDPDKFTPHADTIGGSRWPGEMGAPPA